MERRFDQRLKDQIGNFGIWQANFTQVNSGRQQVLEDKIGENYTTAATICAQARANFFPSPSFSARDAPARADPPVLRPHHGNHSDVAPREDLPAVFSCHRAALRRRKMPSEASPPQWIGRAAVSRGCLPRRPPGAAWVQAGRKLLCLKGKRESPSCGGTAKDQYLRTELRSLCAGSFWFYAALSLARAGGCGVH